MFILYKAWGSPNVETYRIIDTVYVGNIMANPKLEQVMVVVNRKTPSWELVP